MRASEIRDLTTDELLARLKDEQDKLIRMRLNHAVSAIENPTELRDTRRGIARIKTILAERRRAESNNQ